MTRVYYAAEIKAEMSALKDIEKSIKWLHITLRQAEERHIQKELSAEEMALISTAIRDAIFDSKAKELEIFKRISQLKKECLEAIKDGAK